MYQSDQIFVQSEIVILIKWSFLLLIISILHSYFHKFDRYSHAASLLNMSIRAPKFL